MPEARRAVQEDLRARVEARRSEGRIALRWPFVLAVATRHAS